MPQEVAAKTLCTRVPLKYGLSIAFPPSDSLPLCFCCCFAPSSEQVTQDQFDAIDFSDNEIKKLDNFPRYKRLSSLLLCNNHVSRIAADLGSQLPNLTCIILTNNKVRIFAAVFLSAWISGKREGGGVCAVSCLPMWKFSKLREGIEEEGLLLSSWRR